MPVGHSAAENKFLLGFVRGLNNKIRVLQRLPYGLRHEQKLRLQVLTCILPKHWSEMRSLHPVDFLMTD